MYSSRRLLVFLTISIMAVMAWSLIGARDYITWILEALPVIIGFFILYLTHNKFTFTPLSYWLFWFGGVFILIGAHYTYSEMPLFNWLKNEFDLSRNHYDRFGHIVQGIVPAIISRELLLRTTQLKNGIWIIIIVLSICLAKSVVYEFAEWIVAISFGQSADDFLGIQGDQWDAQKDMAWALFGAILSLSFLSKYHDAQLRKYTA